MTKINYDKLKNSLMRLTERFDDYQNNKDHLQDYLLESVKESCIQRFEICMDTAWKHLKKYLEQDLGIHEVVNSPKMIFKTAQSAGVIHDAELWINFNYKRGDTSHDYCGDKAEDVFKIIGHFIHSAIPLYEKMSGEKWGV
jgi:nucleotidyltransferase substrate binding protein (TIGR01987 family)